MIELIYKILEQNKNVLYLEIQITLVVKTENLFFKHRHQVETKEVSICKY